MPDDSVFYWLYTILLGRAQNLDQFDGSDDWGNNGCWNLYDIVWKNIYRSFVLGKGWLILVFISWSWDNFSQICM